MVGLLNVTLLPGPNSVTLSGKHFGTYWRTNVINSAGVLLMLFPLLPLPLPVRLSINSGRRAGGRAIRGEARG